MGKFSARFEIESLESRRLMSSGLQGVYYDNTNFTGKSVSRVDSQVNFNWAGAPVSGIGADTFAVRWTGTVTAKHTQKYTFYVDSNNGARLWVNHKLLIDDWNWHDTKEDKGSISLTAGKAYDIQLEMFDSTGTAVAELKWSSTSTIKAVVPSAQLKPAAQNLKDELDHAMAFANAQLKVTASVLAGKTNEYVLRTSPTTGAWKIVNADDWTAGYTAGNFWQMYQATGDSYWSNLAKEWTTTLAGQAVSRTGDLSVAFMPSYEPLYEMTKNSAYLQVLEQAAASKNNMWNQTVGAFETTWRQSNSGNPDANYGVLMDQTEDMELMLWVAKETGNTTYTNRVLQHVRNVIQYLVRPDGSTAQWGYFDSATGKFVDDETYQGFANDSTWSRGQAWAIHSFTTVAAYTGAPDVLAAAEKVANWYISHLPSDSVPYWDFNDPKIPNALRDSSAAAIAASGLVQLSTLVTGSLAAKYKSAAGKILASLASPAYLAEGSKSQGILLHGSQDVPHDKNGDDVSLVFGDYYFLQAVNRYMAL